MKAKIVHVNSRFIGRKQELDYLRELSSRKRSGILVVYGRRRG